MPRRPRRHLRALPNDRFFTLLKRAAMNIFQFNTRVVRATDRRRDHRVLVTTPFQEGYDDCVGIGFRTAGDGPGIWHVGAYSPARARLIAYQILSHAAYLERTDPGLDTIDEEDAA
jgi:hypothetical protein